MHTPQAFIARLIADDSGQDIVEYGLLGVLIGIVGVLIFPSIEEKIAAAFGSWGDNVNACWQPSDPGAGSSCP